METQLIIDKQYLPASDGATLTRDHPITTSATPIPITSRGGRRMRITPAGGVSVKDG
jgi:hypothetical protein